MEHETFDNESDNDDVDDEEVPRTPRAPKAAKNGAPGAAAPSATKKASNKESERKKRELITMGKAKGFLTYDEVNEHMPENIVSSDQMDDWLSAFSGEGIEIVDSASKIKVAEKPEAADEDEDEEAEDAAKKEDEEEEDVEGYTKTNDPVRMYLRKMGSVSLLTREGEVEIAKRIEEGERRILQVVLNSSVAIEEILELGNKLKAQKIRVKEVIRDVDEEDAEFDEEWHSERVCKLIDKVRRSQRENEQILETLDKTPEPKRKKAKEKIEENKQEMFDQLSELRINKKQI